MSKQNQGGLQKWGCGTFGQESLVGEGEGHLEDPGEGGRIILKSSSLGCGPVAGSYGHGI